MCDAVYLNPLDNLKQWHTRYEKNPREKNFRLNTVILTKVKLQSINDYDLPTRASNKLRENTIRLCAVYVCDVTHDEIIQNFSR